MECLYKETILYVGLMHCTCGQNTSSFATVRYSDYMQYRMKAVLVYATPRNISIRASLLSGLKYPSSIISGEHGENTIYFNISINIQTWVKGYFAELKTTALNLVCFCFTQKAQWWRLSPMFSYNTMTVQTCRIDESKQGKHKVGYKRGSNRN